MRRRRSSVQQPSSGPVLFFAVAVGVFGHAGHTTSTNVISSFALSQPQSHSLAPVFFVEQTARRTSELQAPIVMLTGHDVNQQLYSVFVVVSHAHAQQGNVTSLAFAPGGAALASGSFDTNVFLWNTFGANVNYAVLKGHRKAVLAVKWASDGGNVFSASADSTARVWDSETRQDKRAKNKRACVRAC